MQRRACRCSIRAVQDLGGYPIKATTATGSGIPSPADQRAK
jgi:hypothetical protein